MANDDLLHYESCVFVLLVICTSVLTMFDLRTLVSVTSYMSNDDNDLLHHGSRTCSAFTCNV